MGGYLLEHGQHLSGYTTEESDTLFSQPLSLRGRGGDSWALFLLSIHSPLFENVSEQSKLEIYTVIVSMFIVTT